MARAGQNRHIRLRKLFADLLRQCAECALFNALGYIHHHLILPYIRLQAAGNRTRIDTRDRKNHKVGSRGCRLLQIPG